MFKKKEKEKDEFHTEYGILKNSLYVMTKIKQYRPALLWLMLIGVFTNSLMQYLWSFIGKFVIDIVQAQARSPEKDIMPLVKLLIITTTIEIISMLLNTITDNKRWYGFIHTRMKVISERIAKALSMNYEMLENPKILDMHSKATQATGGNNNGIEGLMYSVYDIGVQILLLTASISVIFTLNIWLVLIILVLSVVEFIYFRYTVKKDRKNVWEKLAPVWRKIHYMERATQDFDYAKDIRLFGMTNWLSKKQHEILLEKQNRMIFSRNLWIYNSFFSAAITIIRDSIIYAFLIWNVLNKNMTIGNFTLYLGMTATLSGALNSFFNSLATHKERSMQVDDFRSFMDLKMENEDTCIDIPKSNKYTFVFENVSFKYSGQEEYAVKNLNLTLEAGKRLAVVGLNGAGKTTMIKLLLRLYDVTDGRILMNGIDIRKFRRLDYYKMFSPVFQNVELFAFPMSENVSMNTPELTDKEKSYKCLVKAGMKDKLDSLADGIDTEILKIIYDNGIDLSGGEKQKLALARALYKDAPIVVLDEPTAALDALAEYNLYKSFDEIIADKSAVYISHRLSSTRFCDSIAMFKNGEMIEYGTHEELLSQNGAYFEMFEIQAQYYKDEEVNLNV